jgi:hypothetical protein
MDIILENLRKVYNNILNESNIVTLYHCSPHKFNKFVPTTKHAFGNDVTEQPIFFKETKEESKSMLNCGRYIYTVNVKIDKLFDPSEMYDWSAKWTDDITKLTVLGKIVFDDFYGGDENNIEKLFYLRSGAYDAVEDSNFLKWLRKNNFDSFYVSETGKLSQDKSIGVFFSPEKFKILSIEEV